MIPNSNKMEPTIETVQLAMAGDQDAFGTLIEKYSGLVTGVAYSILGDFDRSEDAGQEAFLEAWKKRDTLHDPTKFGSWLCSIARHRALDLVRKRARTETGTASLTQADVASKEPAVEETVLRDEEKTLVWNSLDGLPQTYRDVMVLYYRGDESVAAVADSLGESESTIRQRLHRGRELLRVEVDAIIRQTLRGTAPKAVFTAAVLGSLPGNAYAATAAAGSVGASKAAVSGTVLSTAAAGGILGALGGIAGAGLGAWQTYRTSPYAGQRRLVVRFVIFECLLCVLFSFLLWWLISVRTSENPMPDDEYGTRLMALIFGFQGVFALSTVVFMWLYSRAKAKARAAGESLSPDYKNAALAAASPKRQYTSPSGLWGLPWLDVQFAERTEDCSLVDAVPARGWIAIGDRAHGRLVAMGDFAIGPVAVGGKSIGVIAIGGLCFGVVAIGGLAIGGLTVGGLAMGGLAFGGLAIGYHALGGGAFGWASARGGGAWSHGYAEGGNVLSGSNDPALAKAFSDGWVSQISQLDTWPPVLVELAIILGVAMFCGLALLQIATNKLLEHTLQTKESSADLEQAKLKSNMAGVLGGMLGGTAWIALLGFQSEQWSPGVVPLTLYLIAVAFVWRMYVRSSKAATDESAVPRSAFTKGLIGLNIATTLGLIYLAKIGFQQPQSYLWLSTAWVVSQMIYATSFVLIRIVLSPRVEARDLGNATKLSD